MCREKYVLNLHAHHLCKNQKLELFILNVWERDIRRFFSLILLEDTKHIYFLEGTFRNGNIHLLILSHVV